jgi:DUF4097 and DUF4098 domain-containing protein YvlB
MMVMKRTHGTIEKWFWVLGVRSWTRYWSNHQNLRPKTPNHFSVVLFSLFILFPLSGYVTQSHAQVTGQGREFHETYDLTPDGIISVNNLSGNIRVTSWNENKVKVDAIKRGDREEEINLVEVQVVARPERIDIRTIFPRRRANRVSVDFELKVPRTAALSPLIATSGNISVIGPVARVVTNAISGDVTVQEISGDTNLNTTSGNISATRINGELRANTVSGHLSLNDVAIRLFANCQSGNLTAIQVRGDATVSVESGDVRLDRIGGRADARVMSGSILANEVGGDAEMRSLSGNVTITGVGGRVNAVSYGGNVLLRKVAGGARVNVTGGKIEIFDAKDRIEATTIDGEIILSNIDSKDVRAKTISGNIQFNAKLYNDGVYDFQSLNGAITLILPPESNFILTTISHFGSVNTEFQIKFDQIKGRTQLKGIHGEGGADLRAQSFNGTISIRKKK